MNINNAVIRSYINIDWEKMKDLHPASEPKCIKSKWELFREDWAQGFDSDCFVHCSNYENCYKAFNDKNTHLVNHIKKIVVFLESEPCVDDVQFILLVKNGVN